MSARALRHLALAAAALLVAACASNSVVAPDSVAGTYVRTNRPVEGSNGLVADTLVLRADGRGERRAHYEGETDFHPGEIAWHAEGDAIVLSYVCPPNGLMLCAPPPHERGTLAGTTLTLVSLMAVVDNTPAIFARVGSPLPPLVSDDVAFRRLAPDGRPFEFHSGFAEPARLVIADAAAWREAWATLYSRHDPLPAPPAVDFARERVLVAALGARPTGGYAITLMGAHVEGGEIVANVLRVRPGARCIVTQATTAPVDLAVVGRTPTPVRFVERDSVVECP